jgi:hypothetical protein
MHGHIKQRSAGSYTLANRSTQQDGLVSDLYSNVLAGFVAHDFYQSSALFRIRAGRGDCGRSKPTPDALPHVTEDARLIQISEIRLERGIRTFSMPFG